MDERDFHSLREEMVLRQLIGRGISDSRILDIFRKIPRHLFIGPALQDRAYEDYPLPIGSKQTISQPYMVALMTQSLGLKGAEKVLEVGTGSGYQTAVLAEASGKVYSVERIDALAAGAGRVLDGLGYKNVAIKTGDGTLGWAEHAPYDAIIVTAGAPGVPESLAAQLGDGGRMVIPIGSGYSQILTIVEKKNGVLQTEEVCGCVFVPLLGEEGWSE